MNLDENKTSQNINEDLTSNSLDQIDENSVDLLDNEINDEEEDSNQNLDEIETYHNLSKQELYETAKNLIETLDVNSAKSKIEYIKTLFYKKVQLEYDNSLKIFLSENVDLTKDDFTPETEQINEDFKALLKIYREARELVRKNEEKEKNENLKIKKDIISNLQELIKGEETLKKTYDDFLSLQEKWRNTGLIPQKESKQLWNDYHHHVQNFYDWVKLNKEAKDLDLKRNLEEKLSLCEKAEELLIEQSLNKAFENLQILHDKWKETGPVPENYREEIWERFQNATKNIHKKRQEYFESLISQQKDNFIKKSSLCNKLESILSENIDSHKKWQEANSNVDLIRDEWKKIGFAPKNVNNEIWKKFRELIAEFYEKKNDFYKSERDIINHNINLKKDLIAQAENLKNDTNWKETSKTLIKLQQDWKKIGIVPKKQSDKLWKQFREACDNFFAAKSKHFESQASEQFLNLEKKKEILEILKSYEIKDDNKSVLNDLKDFQRKWMEIGFIPIKEKDKLNKEFKDIINNLYDTVNIDSKKRTILKFQNTVDSLKDSENNSKLTTEKNQLQKQIKEVENMINTWDNNMGFFASSKNAESLKLEISKKIEKAQSELSLLKEKLKIINTSSK